MATESSRTNNSLAEVLFQEPYRFDFFQAVRVLERVERERRPVGRQSEPSREVVRFRSLVSLTFPASQIHHLEPADEDSGQPPQMTVAFMGATGPAGVLPHHYTELLVERNRYKDTGLWEFLDLFNHRMISLFYRAWEKYHFPVAFERGDDDQFTQYLFGLIGMGTPALRNRQSFADEALIFYGGLFGQRPHSSSAVEAILGDYFDAPAHIGQFAGQWLKLDEADQTRLGSANSELGFSTVAGARVWDTQSKFRVRLGPLSFDKFAAFLPVGSAFKPASELVRLLTGMEFDFDVQLTLKAEEVPPCVLTTHARRKPMLGWTTWLRTSEFTEDDSQVVLAVPA